jgi:hypothetical protein
MEDSTFFGQGRRQTSTCLPPMHLWRREDIWSMTFSSIGTVIATIPSLIISLSSFMSLGFFAYTVLLRLPQRKKSKRVKSGDLAWPATAPDRRDQSTFLGARRSAGRAPAGSNARAHRPLQCCQVKQQFKLSITQIWKPLKNKSNHWQHSCWKQIDRASPAPRTAGMKKSHNIAR